MADEVMTDEIMEDVVIADEVIEARVIEAIGKQNFQNELDSTIGDLRNMKRVIMDIKYTAHYNERSDRTHYSALLLLSD